MKKYRVKADSLSDLMKILKGIFDLTPKEVDQLTNLILLCEEEDTNGIVTRAIKNRWGETIELPPQSIRNKLTIFRNKGALIDNTLHPFFASRELQLIVEYESTENNSKESSEEIGVNDDSSK